MLNKKKALLLIGSPKKKNGTSEALGNYLLKGLEKRDFAVEKIHAISIMKDTTEELHRKVNDCDILIITFPLYVDSLPAPLIAALESIGKNRKTIAVNKEQSLIAIANCGFPESFHNNVALRICKSFATDNSFKWIGGLTLGGGGSIDGRPIEKLGGMTRNIVKALDLATEAIVSNNHISKEAMDMMSGKLMPTWIYTLAGNRMWKTQGKKYNSHKKLYDKPYI